MSKPRLPTGTSAVKLALATRQFRTEIGDADLLLNEPLAIVGMACRFPGGAHSPEEYWSLLTNKGDAIVEVPPTRWDIDAYFDPDPDAPGKMNTRWGGFLRQPVDLFDPKFFGIAPREAASMDPQQRLLLEVAWEAIEDAGQTQERLAGSDTGVFFAIYGPDYGQQLNSEREAIDAYTTLGTAACVAAGRLSFLLDLRGPSMVVDTACSSSLVAIHLACQSLRTGECRAAIAGGVSLALTPDRNISLSKWRFMSPDGRCKAFDSRADGWVRGDGAGTIVLKRLADAIADGDRVLAVVRGSAVNQDGRSTVLTAPNGMAQEAVVRAALKSGRVAPAEITFVEAHGTGTSIGDPIELEALVAVLGAPVDGSVCRVGAVKNNIGHLEAAAGIASVIKTVLALQHELIPGNAHFNSLNPLVSLEGTRIQVPADNSPWARGATRRLAGVSGFGFSGTNAHVVLEEAPTVPAPPAEPSGEAVFMLPISARAPEALGEMAAAYAGLLRRDGADAPRLLDVCYTAATRRTHHDHRAVAIGPTRHAVADALDALARGEVRFDVVNGRRLHGRRPDAVWVFSGQGPQWWAMGRDLFGTEPLFRGTVEQVDRLLREHTGWSLVEELHATEAASRLDQTEIAQPAIFALQAGLAALLRSWGLEPAAVVGHSVGEVAAAHVAGVLDLQTAVRVVFTRARLMQQGTGRGRMAAVGLSADEVRTRLAGHAGRMSIAAVNAPRSVTVSGEPASVQALVDGLQREQVFARILPVDYAFHSEQMAPYAAELAATLAGVSPARPTVPIVSTVTGQMATPTDYDAKYWGRNVREAVQLWPAIDGLVHAGHTAFLEIAPHPVLGPSLRQALEGRVEEPTIAATLHRGRSDHAALRAAVAALHTGGCVVDWSRLVPRGGRVVSLPAYAWQRQRYWAEVGDYRPGGPRRPMLTDHANGRLPGRRLQSLAITGAVFETEVDADSPPFVRDHQVHETVLFPATAFLAMAHAGVMQATSANLVHLERVSIEEPLALERGAARTLQLVVDGAGATRTFRIASLDDEAEGRWKVHVTGSATAEPAMRTETDAPFDAIRSRCEEVIEPRAWYAALGAVGFTFGPAFQTIRAVRRRDGEALAEVALPHGVATDGFAVHPVLLDGCIQAAWAALPDRVRLAAGADAYVPVGVGALQIHRDAPSHLFSHVTLAATGEGTEAFSATIRSYDAAGQLVVFLDDVRLKRASRDSVIRATRRPTDDWLYEVAWAETPRTSQVSGAADDSAGAWIMFPDHEGFSRALTTELGHAGVAVQTVEDGADVARVIAESHRGGRICGVIDCRALDLAQAPARSAADLHTAHRHTLGGALELTQALAHVACVPHRGLVVLTRGALPVEGEILPAGLSQGALHGLMRTLSLEHPELGSRCLDLDPARPAREPAMVAAELLGGTDGEEQLAFRRGVRYAARLTRLRRRSRAAAGPVRLEIAQRGTLEQLALRPLVQPAPGDGEVVLAVEAAGLNFRDVLNTLGMYPGDAGPLGSECAGTVVAVGAGVNRLSVGDRVVALAQDCFGSFATVLADLAVVCPEGLCAEDAATLPVTFMTARYGLEQLGKMRGGDRVLIHAAAGGVGLAAVQLAQRVGAEVFATAGSPEKHAFLRALGVTHVMNSRTLEFADQIRERTGGRGVDIVLNSLAGDFIDRSLSVLAPRGRFIEIGKTGIWTAEAVARVRPDVDYHVLYLGEVVERDPHLGHTLLRSVVDDVARGHLRPLTRRSFRLDDAARAFRYMAQARHIGKIVLKVPAADHALEIRSDATYLISGGMGALGLSVAEGLARAGARRLILMGRRVPSPSASGRITALREQGAEVRTVTGDVSSQDDVIRVLGAVDSSHPLRGVVHAAGVLDDGVMLQQSWERFDRVLAPKVSGAWHLHAGTRSTPLDFFVLFSSVASVLGSAGQGSYGAANAFMDGLAYIRRSEGLPAISINWGAWADGGMASALGEADKRRWASIGMEAIQPLQGVHAMLDVLASATPQVTVMPISWRGYAEGLGDRRVPPLVRDLVRAVGLPQPAQSAGSRRGEKDLAARLAGTSLARRPAVLLAFVTEQAIKALGLPASFPLDPNQGLRDVGLDSLMSIELRNRLQEAVGQPLPATLAFDFPTAGAIAAHLSTQVLKLAVHRPAETAAVEAGVQELADLSDNEAEELLRRELEFTTGRTTRGKP
jgi:acyl transferase domain-containing protein/acyl carrier protein